MELNTRNWKVLTPNGFEPFVGVACNGVRQTLLTRFTDNTFIVTTPNHRLFANGKEILAEQLRPSMTIDGVRNKTVVDIHLWKHEEVYDVVGVPSQTFLYEGIVSHNCEFVSSDPLLIDSIVLANLTLEVKNIKPIGKVGDIVFYKKPQPNTIYLIGMDCATGNGKDYTTLVAYEFPSLEQVAEWRSNTMSTVLGYHTLKKLLRVFENSQSIAYFSAENNGVGEGIVALYEADEDPPHTAEFVSEDGARKKGFVTTGKSKMKGCLMYKEMLERGALHIKSKMLVEESKMFVRKAGSYAAKLGGTDDLIMGTIIALRILESISNFDQDAYNALYSHTQTDNQDTHMEEYDNSYVEDGFVVG